MYATYTHTHMYIWGGEEWQMIILSEYFLHSFFMFLIRHIIWHTGESTGLSFTSFIDRTQAYFLMYKTEYLS